MLQSDWNCLSADERVPINQLANGAEPAKELQKVIDHEGAASPAGQYAQMLLDVMPDTVQRVQRTEDKTVLPIQITARNEEISLPLTVKTLMHSAIDFRKTHPSFHIAIVICNNASTDETTAAVARVYHENKNTFLSNHISLEVIYEGKPGKINGIRTGTKHLHERFGDRFTHVLSGDADVEWDQGAIRALWETAHPPTGARPLLVGSRITPRNRKTIWGHLEEHVYYGYGILPPRNQGLFMKFVSGMGYLADKSVLFHWANVPDEIGLDDVVLSVLVGAENIVIAPSAIVRYDLSEDWDTFVKIRGRHLTEILRIEKWLSGKHGEEKGVAMVSSIAELCALKIADGFFTPTDPLEPLTGSPFKTFKKFIRHIKSVPILNLRLMHGLVGTLLLSAVYLYLTFRGLKQNYDVPDRIALMGLWKKDTGRPYVKFLQDREFKRQDKSHAVAAIKSSLWNPALQRKDHKKTPSSPVRDFLSNNETWAYAVVLPIVAFILGFIIKHIFLLFSEALSAIGMQLLTSSDTGTPDSHQAFIGTFANGIGHVLKILSNATSFICQQLVITAVVTCCVIYVYLFVLQSLQNMTNGKRVDSKFMDSLKRTSKEFLNIVALPFMAFEKVVLSSIAIPLLFAKLIFRKTIRSRLK